MTCSEHYNKGGSSERERQIERESVSEKDRERKRERNLEGLKLRENFIKKKEKY